VNSFYPAKTPLCNPAILNFGFLFKLTLREGKEIQAKCQGEGLKGENLPKVLFGWQSAHYLLVWALLSNG